MDGNVLISILDDDPYDCELIGRLLNKNGFPNYKTFTMSVLLLENLDTNSRIFIIDYKIDAMNGMEVIEKIRKIIPQGYFIMLSGMKDYRIVEEFNNAGLRGKYITKGEHDTDSRIINFIHEFIKDMILMKQVYNDANSLMDSFQDMKKLIEGNKDATY